MRRLLGIGALLAAACAGEEISETRFGVVSVKLVYPTGEALNPFVVGAAKALRLTVYSDAYMESGNPEGKKVFDPIPYDASTKSFRFPDIEFKEEGSLIRLTAEALNENGEVTHRGVGRAAAAMEEVSSGILLAPVGGVTVVREIGSSGLYRPTVTTTHDGRVLVAGGYRGVMPTPGQAPPLPAVDTTWILDPYATSDGNLVKAGPKLTKPRARHAAVAVGEGKVLLLGGQTTDGSVLDDAELVDLTAGTAEPYPISLQKKIMDTPGGLLLDDRYGVAYSGFDGGAPVRSAAVIDLYADPPTLYPDRVPLHTSLARMGHFMVALPSGQLLIGGGADGTGADDMVPGTLLYGVTNGEPDTVFKPGAASLVRSRYGASAAVLDDGRVVVVGGFDRPTHNCDHEWDPSSQKGTVRTTVEVLDAAGEKFEEIRTNLQSDPQAQMELEVATCWPIVAPVGGSRVLVVGVPPPQTHPIGQSRIVVLDVDDPSKTERSRGLGPSASPERRGAAWARLESGAVVMAGGSGATQLQNKQVIEIYQP